MSLLSELNRRNVTRAALIYMAGAWLLIQVADTIFPAFGISDRALTVLIIGTVIAFVPSMVLAWAFELTPEGFLRDHGAAPAPAKTRAIDRAIIVILALAVAYFAFDKFVLSTGEQDRIVAGSGQDHASADIGLRGRRSIAVLAFEDKSPGGGHEFLADGIAEDILGLLTQVRGLRVTARTSSFWFKNKEATLAEIGDHLNVSAILEGSISRAGDRLRVTVMLSDVDTETAVWSKTYTRKIESIFDIQDDIASRVIFELEASMIGSGPKINRVHPAAYALYLNARQLNHRSNPVDAAAAIPMLEQAIAIEPGYALAIAEMARAVFLVGVRQEASHEENRPTWEKSIALIEQAQSFDPTHPFIVAWRGWIEVMYRKDLDRGLAHLDRALELGPNNYDAMRLAIIIYGANRLYDRAVALSERLLPRDPFCLVCQFSAAVSYAATGRIRKARPGVEFLLTSAPEGLFLSTARLLMSVTHVLDGNPQEALDILATGPAHEPYGTLVRLAALHDLHRTEAARALFAASHAEWMTEWPLGLAAAYAWQGDFNRAFEWIDRDIARFDHTRKWQQTVVTSFFRPLKEDPRWEQVIRRVSRLHQEAVQPQPVSNAVSGP
ncbi:MAG: hypothetical protein QNJ40_19925 [Xanthomonadales bacterium]|nr:hypothetical protein [Xanthomonadales bacterium]